MMENDLSHAPALVLTGYDLDMKSVIEVARYNRKVSLSPAALDRLRLSREIVFEVIQSGRLFYAINTGVGSKVGTEIPPQEWEEFQRTMALSHSICIGEAFSVEAVRAAMTLRINNALMGAAGIQPEIVVRLADMLNCGITPIIPMMSSIGASDIGQGPMVMLALMGMDDVMYQGRRIPAREAFAQNRLELIKPGPKDTICMINSNWFSTGLAELVLWDCENLLDLADISYALLLEGFRGNVTPLRPNSFKLRPHTGQMECMKRVRKILAGSFLWEDGAARRVQDPISIRSTVQMHGAVREVFAHAKRIMDIEINSMGDNPMVVLEERDMISNGQYLVPGNGMAMDSLRIALANLATTISLRIFALNNAQLSGLPDYLAPETGVYNNGYATAQKTVGDLQSRIRHLANPVTMDYLPLNQSVEDLCTMTPLAVQKTAEILPLLEKLIGIEMMQAAQAVDIIGKPKLGKATEAAYQAVRSVIPTLDADRIPCHDFNKAGDLISSGYMTKATRAALES